MSGNIFDNILNSCLINESLVKQYVNTILSKAEASKKSLESGGQTDNLTFYLRRSYGDVTKETARQFIDYIQKEILSQNNITPDVAWIIKNIAKGDIVLPDDEQLLKQDLAIFSEYKTHPKFLAVAKEILPDDKKDQPSSLSSWPSYGILRQAVSTIRQALDEEERGAEPATVGKWREWVIQKNRELVLEETYNTKEGPVKYELYKFTPDESDMVRVYPRSVKDGMNVNWQPVLPNTDTTSAQVRILPAAAMGLACEVSGRGVCVANPETAANYMKRGPMFLLKKNGVVELVLDPAGEEIKNADNMNFSGFDQSYRSTNSSMSVHLAKFLGQVILYHKDVFPTALYHALVKTLKRYGSGWVPVLKEKGLYKTADLIEAASIAS